MIKLIKALCETVNPWKQFTTFYSESEWEESGKFQSIIKQVEGFFITKEELEQLLREAFNKGRDHAFEMVEDENFDEFWQQVKGEG